MWKANPSVSQIPACSKGGKNRGKESGSALFTGQLSPWWEEKVLTGAISELLADAQLFRSVTEQRATLFTGAALNPTTHPAPAGLVVLLSAQRNTGPGWAFKASLAEEHTAPQHCTFITCCRVLLPSFVYSTWLDVIPWKWLHRDNIDLQRTHPIFFTSPFLLICSRWARHLDTSKLRSRIFLSSI